MNYLLNMRTRTWVTILIIALIGLYGIYRSTKNTGTKTDVPATMDTATSTITELKNAITAVGSVVPVQKADIGFNRGGIVTALPYPVGARVAKGTVLGIQSAAGMQADVLKAKSDSRATQADLMKAETVLMSHESQKGIVLSQAYAKAEDAVRKQLDPLFVDDEHLPRLAFQTKDSQVENDIYVARAATGRSIDAWQKLLASENITDAVTRLTNIRTLFYLAHNALTAQASLDSATLAAYKTATATGLDGINATLTAVNDLAQKIRSQEAEIKAQTARVVSANAAIAQAEARLAESYLIAPFAGVLTAQHTEVGQFIAAGAPAFSLAGSAFELQSDIPEAYIGRIRTGMPVSIMLDAYPEEAIAGAITSVEPAGRPINDVIYYRVKIAVDNAKYAAFLKNGLTANITIE